MFGIVTLTLAEAHSIADAAITKARQLNVNVSVAVCDERCRVIALDRMDGTYAEANRFALGKAIASAGTGLPSGEVKGIIDSQAEIVGAGAPPIGIRGGLPIFRNDLIEGACGVDGALAHEQEEECARAGILRCGLLFRPRSMRDLEADRDPHPQRVLTGGNRHRRS